MSRGTFQVFLRNLQEMSLQVQQEMFANLEKLGNQVDGGFSSDNVNLEEQGLPV